MQEPSNPLKGKSMDFATQHRLISRELASVSAELRNLAPPVKHWRVAYVIREIHEHLFDFDLNATWVQQHCGIHSKAFASLFTQHCGRSIRCYIEAKRMEAATHLLKFDGLMIATISTNIGYADPCVFASAFRRCFGCSAGEYRRVSLQPNPHSEKGDSGSSFLLGA